MKSKIKIFFMILTGVVILFFGAIFSESGANGILVNAEETQKDILFIGNSMTYYNTLCNVVQGIATRKGHNIKCSAATNGGKNLIYNEKAGNVVSAIKKKKSTKAKIKLKKVKGASGYQIKIGITKKLRKSRKISFKKNTFTVKKLRGKKQYCLKVRVYKVSDGVRHYSKWSGIKKIKIKKQ